MAYEYWVSFSFDYKGREYRGTDFISSPTELKYDKNSLKIILTRLMIRNGLGGNIDNPYLSSFIVYDIKLLGSNIKENIENKNNGV